MDEALRDKAMREFGSKRNKLLCATAATAMLALAGCGSPQSANTMSLYGKDTDEDTRARVDRLVAYCQRLSKAGDFYLSSGMCARAHELDPTNPLPLFVMAENFERFDKNDHAIHAYQALLENQPKNSEASYRLAKLQLDEGYEHEALQTVQVALEHEPNEPRLMNVIGVIKDQQGDHDTAQFYYREALALQPDNVSISNNLGLSLALSGKGEQAVAVLNDVVDDPDATATSRHNLALAYAAAEADAEREAAEAAEVEVVEPEQESFDQESNVPEAPQESVAPRNLLSSIFRREGPAATQTAAVGAPLPLMTSSFAEQAGYGLVETGAVTGIEGWADVSVHAYAPGDRIARHESR
jgi:Flp pilus assembly protein TadD